MESTLEMHGVFPTEMTVGSVSPQHNHRRRRMPPTAYGSACEQHDVLLANTSNLEKFENEASRACS